MAGKSKNGLCVYVIKWRNFELWVYPEFYTLKKWIVDTLVREDSDPCGFIKGRRSLYGQLCWNRALNRPTWELLSGTWNSMIPKGRN